MDAQGHSYLSDFNIATTLKDDPLKAIAGTEPCNFSSIKYRYGSRVISRDWLPLLN